MLNIRWNVEYQIEYVGHSNSIVNNWIMIRKFLTTWFNPGPCRSQIPFKQPGSLADPRLERVSDEDTIVSMKLSFNHLSQYPMKPA